MKRLLIVMALLIQATLTHAAPAMPLSKTGTCPAGYAVSGGYCKPRRHARFAVEKHGGCPAGYSASGGYCLAGRSACTAVKKTGACPAGWQPSGNYCLENR